MAVLLSVAAMAQPRIAMQPLELGHFPLEQREPLKAQLAVMVARVPNVAVAGTARTDEALARAAVAGCEVEDRCLRLLAEATDSLYGMYVRLDPAVDGAIATARVVRADGVVVRQVRVDAESPRGALQLVVRELKLEELPATLPPSDFPIAERPPEPQPDPGFVPVPYAAPLTPAPLVQTQSAPPSTAARWKRVAGWSLVGVGAATLVTGAVFAGLAVSGAAAYPPDAFGVVPASGAARAADAIEQSQVASVLIPAGATAAALGAVLVLWGNSARGNAVTLGVAPIGGGAAATFSGRLP